MQNKKEKIIIDPSNFVHTMMVNEEKIRKETTFLDRRGHDRPYTVNPKTLHNITDKPNHVTPKQPFKEAVKPSGLTDDYIGKRENYLLDRTFQLESMKRQIQQSSMLPRQKFRLPQTTNQDFGWFTEPLVKPSERWDHRLKKDPLTGYASQYVKLKAVNPFKVKER